MLPKSLGGWVVVCIFMCGVITILTKTGIGFAILDFIQDPVGSVPTVDIKR